MDVLFTFSVSLLCSLLAAGTVVDDPAGLQVSYGLQVTVVCKVFQAFHQIVGAPRLSEFVVIAFVLTWFPLLWLCIVHHSSSFSDFGKSFLSCIQNILYFNHCSGALLTKDFFFVVSNHSSCPMGILSECDRSLWGHVHWSVLLGSSPYCCSGEPREDAVDVLTLPPCFTMFVFTGAGNKCLSGPFVRVLTSQHLGSSVSSVRSSSCCCVIVRQGRFLVHFSSLAPVCCLVE